jgi:hypothetical protein
MRLSENQLVCDSLNQSLFCSLLQYVFYYTFKKANFPLFFYVRLFQNFSFETATLDLREKAGSRPLFPKACEKTIGFWNRLMLLAAEGLQNARLCRRSLGLPGQTKGGGADVQNIYFPGSPHPTPAGGFAGLENLLRLCRPGRCVGRRRFLPNLPGRMEPAGGGFPGPAA